MIQTIQVKRGLKSNLPILLMGEFGFCTDTKELFIGDGSKNILLGQMGATGPQGIQGIQGLKGDKGDTGAKGDVGLQGPIGLTGPIGIQGLKGNDGYTPIKGIDYFDGAKGDIGLTGSQGLKGDKGDKGAPFIYTDFTPTQLDGLKGAKGDTGPQGIQGIQGAKGDTGAKGEQGIQGLQGIKGDTGAKGEQGLQGIKGDTGLTGANGAKGDKGADGLTTSIKLGTTQYNQSGGIVSLPAYPTSLPASGGNADTVGGFTVGANVPVGAKFTDTVYIHPTGTNPHGTTRADIGLTNVDNTADISKPVSTAQQNALNLKANVASPTFTGTPKSITPATVDNSTNIATTAFVKAQGYITSAGSGARITTSTTAPSSPSSGEFWYKEI